MNCVIFAAMFGRILASAALFLFLVPQGNHGAAAAYLPLNDTAGTLEQARIDSIRRDAITDSVIAVAKQSLGLRYHYGGNSPVTGFDCSHFVAHAFGQLGIILPCSSLGLAAEGKEIPLDSVRKGDLMFFKGRNTSTNRVGHVSLVIEAGPGSIKIIHSTNRGVVIDEYYKMDYYKQRFLQARRLNY